MRCAGLGDCGFAGDGWTGQVARWPFARVLLIGNVGAFAKFLRFIDRASRYWAERVARRRDVAESCCERRFSRIEARAAGVNRQITSTRFARWPVEASGVERNSGFWRRLAAASEFCAILADYYGPR